MQRFGEIGLRGSRAQRPQIPATLVRGHEGCGEWREALRLRQQSDGGGATIFKLTQKVPSPAAGTQQGFITDMYLSEDEFRVLAQLPAKGLKKTHYSVPPFGIDVFKDTLEGLVLAEAGLDSALEADGLVLPAFIIREVSTNDRFRGGRLARASPQELQCRSMAFGPSFPGADPRLRTRDSVGVLRHAESAAGVTEASEPYQDE